MNVLFVFDVPIFQYKGGVERITHTLAENFKKVGHNVVFLARIARENNLNIEQAAPQFLFPNTDIYSRDNLIFYHKFIEEHNINVVINQNGAEQSSYLYCNVPNGVKLITVNHTYPAINYYTMRYSMANFLCDYSVKSIIKYVVKALSFPVVHAIGKYKVKNRLNKLYRFILDRSDKFVVLSAKYIKDIEFMTDGRCDYSKLVVIPNANSFEDGLAIEQQKKKQVLYVGRFSIKEKRPDRVLYIWERLYKKHVDWELVIVGWQNKRYEKYMRTYVKRRGIERVSFYSNMSAAPFFEQASLFCLVSNYEGFGLVLTEAMQHGVVPLAFNSFGAASDIIQEGETGFLITPFDYDQFAAKVSELMLDEGKRKKIAQNAIKSVKKFNLENIYPQWKEMIEKLMYNPPNP